MRHKEEEEMSFSEDIEWRARVFSDKVLKAEVQNEIKKLALVLLGNHKLKISYSKEGFETRNHRTMHYMGRWREWVVLGRTKTDVYLEVLKMLANDSSTYYPVVSYRLDDQWVESEGYKNLNDKFVKLQEENEQRKEVMKDNGIVLRKDYEKEREEGTW
jgi:hypothetical protein